MIHENTLLAATLVVYSSLSSKTIGSLVPTHASGRSVNGGGYVTLRS